MIMCWTVSAQPYSSDSVMYSREMDLKAIECMINKPKLQEQIRLLIDNALKYENIVENDSIIISKKEDEIQILSDELIIKEDEIKAALRGKAIWRGVSAALAAAVVWISLKN